MENQCIAGNYFLTEFHIVYLHEICRIALRLVDHTQHKQSASLGHGLDKQNTRHNGFLREMSLEERFVDSNILDTDNIVRTFVDYFVNEQERIAVRQMMADSGVIHQRLYIRIIDRSLDLVAFDVVADFFSERCVYCMSGTSGDNTSFQRTAYKGNVADKIHQFMARRLVLMFESVRIDITEVIYPTSFGTHLVSYSVECFLRHGAVVDNNGIGQVTSFYKICLKKRFYFAQEHKRTRRSYFLAVSAYVIHRRILVRKYGRFEIHLDIDTEFVVGEQHQFRTAVSIGDFHFMLDVIKFLVALLLFSSYGGNGVEPWFRATVEDGNLCTVNIDQAVVNTCRIEG